MKVIGIDPGKTGGIFIYETEGDPDGRKGLWFAHTYDWKPYRIIRIPLTEPQVTLTLKRDKKGRRIKKTGKQWVDYTALAVTIRDTVVPMRGEKVYVFCERVSGSVSSGPQAGGFNFGKTYGFLLGVFSALGYEPELVSPQIWKAAVGIVDTTKVKAPRRKKGEPKPPPPPKWKKGDPGPKPPKPETLDKKVSCEKAAEYFPAAASEFARVSKDDGVAESALICQYGLIKLGADL